MLLKLNSGVDGEKPARSAGWSRRLAGLQADSGECEMKLRAVNTRAPKATSTGFQAKGLGLEVREAAPSAGSTCRPQLEVYKRRCEEAARSAGSMCRPQIESKRTQKVRKDGAKRLLEVPTHGGRRSRRARSAPRSHLQKYKFLFQLLI